MRTRFTLHTVLIALIGLLVLPSLALAVSVTDVVEMFKYTYGSDKMMYLASLEVVLWNLLKRRKREIGGRGQWILPIQKQNAGVFVGMAEGGALTTRRAQPDTAEATFGLKEFQAVWDISWKMLRQASKSEYAFEKAADFMDNSLRRRVFRLINADLLSNTGRGELAIMSGVDDQATITFNALPLCDLGMYVDLMDVGDDNTKHLDSATVDAINVPSREVTFSGAASSTAAGDYVVVEDSVTSSASRHLYGLGAWLDDANPPACVGNLGGINRSTAGNEYWQGNVMSNGGTLRPWTEDLMLQGEDQVRERGGVPVSRYLTNGAIIRRYHESLIADRFFTFNTIQGLDGKVGVGRQNQGNNDSGQNQDGTGESQYTFSGKPIHAEMYARANTILGWNDEHFFIGHDGTEVPTPLSEIFDNMVPFFTMTDNAKFDCWHYWEAELLCDNPQAGIKYEDIAES